MNNFKGEISTEILQALAAETVEYCHMMAGFTQTAGMVDKRYLTREHRETNKTIAQTAANYNLDSWQDAAGNQWVRLASENPQAKRVILGSHTDTVPNGGKYDGLLGVAAPLMLLKYFAQQGITFDFHLDVVGFGDEEGTRFGCTLLGSSAITGKWSSRWRELQDEEGISLAQALHEFGLDASKVSEAQIDSSQVIAYMETHIEQGPVLEERNSPIAAVSGIAGARRFDIVLEGQAGHAGTVPMALRSDPLVIVSEWVQQVNSLALETSDNEFPVVATIGRLDVVPGAVNVIPGKVALSLDIRSINDQARDELAGKLTALLEQRVTETNLKLKILQTHNAPSVACDRDITSKLAKIVKLLTDEELVLASGAGHDAMALARLVPTAMLFVRCKGGLSHHPDESIEEDDVAVALQANASFLYQLQQDLAAKS